MAQEGNFIQPKVGWNELPEAQEFPFYDVWASEMLKGSSYRSTEGQKVDDIMKSTIESSILTGVQPQEALDAAATADRGPSLGGGLAGVARPRRGRDVSRFGGGIPILGRVAGIFRSAPVARLNRRNMMERPHRRLPPSYGRVPRPWCGADVPATAESVGFAFAVPALTLRSLRDLSYCANLLSQLLQLSRGTKPGPVGLKNFRGSRSDDQRFKTRSSTASSTSFITYVPVWCWRSCWLWRSICGSGRAASSAPSTSSRWS